jgi:hypothetical protein
LVFALPQFGKQATQGNIIQAAKMAEQDLNYLKSIMEEE